MAQKKILQLQRLCGTDLSHSASDVALQRSPDCPNMMRSVPGKVRKRMGYYSAGVYDGRINGRYRIGESEVIHAGTKLYIDGVVRCSSMNDARSSGFCFGSRLYLLDGADYLAVEGSTVTLVKDLAKIPQVTVSRNPDGTGGSVLESVNLLSDGWTDGFYGSETEKTYQLSFAGLSSAAVSARVLESDGVTTRTVEEGSGLSVNRATGVVTFAAAPGKSPAEGKDNVWITAFRDRSEQRKRIVKSDVCTTYGEAGSGARVFVTGCPDYPNRDFWSEADDPTNFPDINYSVLGQDSARIVGYSILGDSIAAHKSDAEGSIYVRRGELVSETESGGRTRSSLVFRTGSVITGRGAVAPKSFAVLGSEPLFLTARGVCALTPSDLTGEKYEQIRSFYVNDRLTGEEGLEQAAAVVYRDFYLLALPSGTVYLLDGQQKDYAAGEPYSNFQYECFVWNGIFARCFWVDGGALCFGDENGGVFRFYTDPEDPQSYCDSGVPVKAHWQTPDLTGSRFDRPKTFRRCSVRLASAVATSVRGSYRKPGGAWITVMDAPRKARYLKFSRLQFSKMTFGCDRTPRTLSARLGIHRTEKAGFRFSNEEQEPFGLEAIAFEYLE
ncbi:MAG: hypothetical protein PUC59_04070 [Firmicutes bacterium]|nr:hypothetical protein [Bacillota bacterium]